MSNMANNAMGVSGQAVQSNGAEPARSSDVYSALIDLSNNTVEVHKLLNDLSSRLAPVLRPSEPSDDKAEGMIGYKTPLADNILDQANKARHAAYRLNDILTRLEI